MYVLCRMSHNKSQVIQSMQERRWGVCHLANTTGLDSLVVSLRAQERICDGNSMFKRAISMRRCAPSVMRCSDEAGKAMLTGNVRDDRQMYMRTCTVNILL